MFGLVKYSSKRNRNENQLRALLVYDVDVICDMYLLLTTARSRAWFLSSAFSCCGVHWAFDVQNRENQVIFTIFDMTHSHLHASHTTLIIHAFHVKQKANTTAETSSTFTYTNYQLRCTCVVTRYNSDVGLCISVRRLICTTTVTTTLCTRAQGITR